ILGDRWLTRQALDEEWSGYALVSSDGLTNGWREVASQEGEATRGYCVVGKADQGDPGWCPITCGGGKCIGMETYDFHPVTAALRMMDVPVGYTPPIGPAILFQLTYNHRDAGLPQIPTFGNLGPKWEFDWSSAISEYPGGGCGVYGCDIPSV